MKRVVVVRWRGVWKKGWGFLLVKIFLVLSDRKFNLN